MRVDDVLKKKQFTREINKYAIADNLLSALLHVRHGCVSSLLP